MTAWENRGPGMLITPVLADANRRQALTSELDWGMKEIGVQFPSLA